MLPALWQASTDPHLHWRPLDTRRQVWVSPLQGHCSFLLGPGAQSSVCVLQESISQSCVSSGSSMVGLMATSSKRAYAIPKSAAPKGPCPCGSPLLTRTSAGNAQTQFCLSLSGVSGSCCAQDLFEPSSRVWWEWGLILNMNSPLLPSCWGFSFALGHGISPHSPPVPTVLLGFL